MNSFIPNDVEADAQYISGTSLRVVVTGLQLVILILKNTSRKGNVWFLLFTYIIVQHITKGL